MNRTEASEVERWRLLDREVQGIERPRSNRAQSVLDIAEDTRALARSRDSDPLDDLLDLYTAVQSDGAKHLIVAALNYLRAETHLALSTTPRPIVMRMQPATV